MVYKDFHIDKIVYVNHDVGVNIMQTFTLGMHGNDSKSVNY